MWLHVGILELVLTGVFAVTGGPSLGFWPEYTGSRRVSLLNGEWQYGLHMDCLHVPGGCGSHGIDSMAPSLDPTSPALTPNKTVVPMSIDAVAPGYPGPRGVAFYRRSFTQRPGPARLQFNACSFYCRVWVDGEEVGDHRAGGYVGFTLHVPSVDAETTRELVVLADNRFNSTTAPMHTGGDFWHYGGLMRDVLLHDLPPAGSVPWPWRAYVLPVEDGYKEGMVNVTIELTESNFTGGIMFQLMFDNDVRNAATVTGEAKHGMVSIPMKVPSPRLWSLQDPQLHTVKILGSNDSAVTERFGLRWWGVDKATSRITLNGEIVKLHGWNHHTQWPSTGASPTNEQLDSDLGLLLKAGANYVRGAHYPQDPRWLDRLDEHGIAMWEETLGPGVSTENMEDFHFFMKYQLQQLDEMLDMSMNHASIMTWAWFNEGRTWDQRVCPAYKACSDRAKERDPTRFRTFADDHTTRGKCFEHASLISLNSYPAWYDHAGEPSYATAFWNQMAEYFQSAYPGKPLVISETGAGAIYEWGNNATDAKWTQRYQVEVISRDVDVALGNRRFSGITLWHFFDFKGNDDAQNTCGPCQYLPNVTPPTCGYVNVSCGQRPGGENHKGVLDFWRREKKAYGVVAAKYNASSMMAASMKQGAPLTALVL